MHEKANWVQLSEIYILPKYDPQKLDQWSSYCLLKCLKWTYLQASQESYHEMDQSHIFNLWDFGKETIFDK